jgi:hypothetical protein
MVICVEHNIAYIIEFKEPVDYFNVYLQKQIDLRLKFNGDEKKITILEINSNNKKFTKSKFYLTHMEYFTYSEIRSFLDLIDSPNKYQTIKSLYKSLTDKNKMWIPNFLKKDKSSKSELLTNVISYEEFEYNFDMMLEELKLYCNTFEFECDEKRIIDSITQDENLKSNIKFCGWKDFWITN